MRSGENDTERYLRKQERALAIGRGRGSFDVLRMELIELTTVTGGEENREIRDVT